jgi:hypothetical protein
MGYETNIVSSDLSPATGYGTGNFATGSHVRFELRTVDLRPPPKRPGILGSILKVFGGLAAPFGFLFGGPIGGAAALGMAGLGATMEQKSMQANQAAQAQPVQVVYPGLSPATAGGMQDSTLALVSAKEGAFGEAIHGR